MNASARFVALLVTVAALTCQVETQAIPIIGTWRLISAEDRLPGGEMARPFGEHPVGSLLYDAAGHVAVQVMVAARAQSPMCEEASPHGSSYLAYFGTYDINLTTHRITHHIQAHVDPTQIGTAHVRTFEMAGHRMTLVEAEHPERRTVWDRID
jgi:hypothetical protein